MSSISENTVQFFLTSSSLLLLDPDMSASDAIYEINAGMLHASHLASPNLTIPHHTQPHHPTLPNLITPHHLSTTHLNAPHRASLHLYLSCFTLASGLTNDPDVFEEDVLLDVERKQEVAQWTVDNGLTKRAAKTLNGRDYRWPDKTVLIRVERNGRSTCYVIVVKAIRVS